MMLLVPLGLTAASVVAAAGTLRMDTYRHFRAVDESLGTRDASPLLVSLENTVVQYQVNVSIGTPPQSLILAVDTGSSDVWVPSTSACGLYSQSTCDGGSFASESSSTFKDLGSGFKISYVDSSGSTGHYFSDSLAVNSVTLKDFEMGLAYDTTVDIGLLGIGFAGNEAGVDKGTVKSHPTFVDALVSAGDIPSTAYSLWLDDLFSSQGSILFGGIDTAKYKGTLAVIDMYPTPSRDTTNVTEFLVALTSVSATSSSGTDQLTPSGYAIPVVLDSGTTLTYVPEDLATVIFNEVGATYNATFEFATVPCSLSNNTGTINFGFGGHQGPQVSVPMSELVNPIKTKRGGYLTDGNGKALCRFGISLQDSSATNSLLFGDTFLRSAYVVYDLENKKVGLAQTDSKSTSSNVVAFPSKGAAIPSATTAPGAADVTAATATAVSTSQSLSAIKGFKSAAIRQLLPLGLWQLVMLAAGVAFFTHILDSRP